VPRIAANGTGSDNGASIPVDRAVGTVVDATLTFGAVRRLSLRNDSGWAEPEISRPRASRVFRSTNTLAIPFGRVIGVIA